MNTPAPKSVRDAFGLIGQLGLTVVACILAGLWAGIKLDALLGVGGIMTALGILGGILAGVLAAGLILYRSIPWKP